MRTTRPNLVIIVTDQQRFDALSAHGGLARTPHFDRLAASGVDLRHHFANAPVCVPSRCSLFTGRYPHAHGVMENDARLGDHEQHLFAVLKAHGYRTGFCGKNHFLPEEGLHVFDHFCAGTEDTPSPARNAYQALERSGRRRLAEVGSWASSQYHDFPDEATTTGVIADSALSFLERQQHDDTPFCLTVSFSDPHAPHLAPRRFAALYPEESIPLPPQPPHGLDGKQPRLKIKQEAQGSLRATDADRRRYLGVYAAMCSFVDEQVGRLLDALKASGRAENTIIAFASDHGDFGFHFNLCKKDLVLLDALLHVPCVIAWPGHIAPQVVDATLSEHVDLVPTLLELLDLPVPAASQGKSLVPLLRGTTGEHKSEIFAEVCYADMRNPYATYQEFEAAWQQARHDPAHPLHETQPFNIPGEATKCVRSQEWKYIWSSGGVEELYHVARDPLEWQNLAARPENAEVLLRLRDRLGVWHMRTEDPLTPQQRAAAAATRVNGITPGHAADAIAPSMSSPASRQPDALE